MGNDTNDVKPDDKDWFLQNLINMTNGTDVSFGITLNVGGFLVSGYLIGGEKYFEGFGNDFNDLVAEEAAESVKELFSQYGAIYQPSDSEEPKPAPSFIHLKNAKFYNTNGNPIPGNRGVWWRGRVSEVGGFMLGMLSAENS